MKLKRTINTKEFNALEDAIKALYTEGKSAGSYILQVEGGEGDDEGEAAELRRAKDREVQARKDAEKKLRELEAKIAGDGELDAKKRGDIETLEKSWSDKLAAKEKELSDKLSAKDAFIKKSLVDSKVAELSAELCGERAAIIAPHLRGRFNVSTDGDAPKLEILDKDGKVSALTIDDLKKEFVANKDFATIIVGSNASGSGAGGANNGKNDHGGAPRDAKGKESNLLDLSTQEMAARIEARLNKGD